MLHSRCASPTQFQWIPGPNLLTVNTSEPQHWPAVVSLEPFRVSPHRTCGVYHIRAVSGPCYLALRTHIPGLSGPKRITCSARGSDVQTSCRGSCGDYRTSLHFYARMDTVKFYATFVERDFFARFAPMTVRNGCVTETSMPLGETQINVHTEVICSFRVSSSLSTCLSIQ